MFENHIRFSPRYKGIDSKIKSDFLSKIPELSKVLEKHNIMPSPTRLEIGKEILSGLQGVSECYEKPSKLSPSAKQSIDQHNNLSR